MEEHRREEPEETAVPGRQRMGDEPAGGEPAGPAAQTPPPAQDPAGEVAEEPGRGGDASSPAGGLAGGRAGDAVGGPGADPAGGSTGGLAEARREQRSGHEDRPGLVDWVFGVIFTPRATFARLAALDRPPLGMLLTVAILITAVSGLVQGTAAVRELAVSMVPGEEPLLSPDVAQNPAMAMAIGAVVAIFGVVLLFLGAGFLHLVADLVGGRGGGVHLLAAMALASLPPNLIGIPLEALAARLGTAGGALRDVGTLAMGLWSMILTYRAVRATKHLSRGDALIVLFVPALVFVALAVVAVLVLAGAAMLTELPGV